MHFTNEKMRRVHFIYFNTFFYGKKQVTVTIYGYITLSFSLPEKYTTSIMKENIKNKYFLALPICTTFFPYLPDIFGLCGVVNKLILLYFS